MHMPTEITPQDDVIDSRGVIARVEWLKDVEDPSETTAEEAAELASLLRLVEEAEGCLEEWEYGAMLVNESYWVEYVKDYADDVVYADDVAVGTRWPFNHIDWQAAADELAQDYMQIKWEGVTFYARY